jgi:hypothetical protein
MNFRPIITLSLSLGIFTSISMQVVAQIKAERYPTAKEMQQVRQKFRQEILSKHTGDGRTKSEEQVRESFVKAWSKVDQAVAPFLGTWSGVEESLLIYPSNTKRRVCLVWNGEATGSLSIGSVFNKQIRTSDNYVYFKEGNYLGIATVKDNKADLATEYPLVDFRALEPPTKLPIIDKQERTQILQEFKAAGCTTSVLSKQQNLTTDETNRKISSLPNGNYYYGESLLPNKVGNNYLIFRKRGKKVTGLQYIVPGSNSCFTGTASQGAITDVTTEFVEPGIGEKRKLLLDKNIDLGSYYRLKFNQLPRGGNNWIQQCTKIFPLKG